MSTWVWRSVFLCISNFITDDFPFINCEVKDKVLRLSLQVPNTVQPFSESYTTTFAVNTGKSGCFFETVEFDICCVITHQ